MLRFNNWRGGRVACHEPERSDWFMIENINVYDRLGVRRGGRVAEGARLEIA